MPHIEEVANSAATSAPGWAYVPDTGYDPSKAAIQPSGARKRKVRFGPAENTAKQNNATLKRLADLEKDNTKELHIAIPSKQKDAGGKTKGKTAVTRKILMAQKTFANYLADEEALAAQEPQPGTVARPKGGLKRPAGLETPPKPAQSVTPASGQPYPGFPSIGFGGVDDSRLLQAVVPPAPSEELIEALVSAPPLSFNAARVQPPKLEKPRRHFCELCGYWGTIKCIQCGTRVCGLNCKRLHDEQRCQKHFG